MTMYVITHKEFNYSLPQNYQTLLVGANKNANPRNYLADNTGENISNKNKSFCELTGLYWIWKNTSDSNVGLCHYRRYFSNYHQRKQLDLSVLLSGKAKPVSTVSLDQDLANADWVVSQPERSGDGTIGENFAKYHHAKDLEITRKVLKKKYPQFVDGFDQTLASERGSFYNMFYTSREQLNEYCNWLFDILFEVEKEVDISSYDNYQQRLFGFLSERLLNAYLRSKNLKIAYRAVYQTDVMSRSYAWHQFIKKIQLTIKK